MKKYSANIIKRDKEGEYVDDFNEWRYATSVEDALRRFKEDYPSPWYEIIVTGSV